MDLAILDERVSSSVIAGLLGISTMTLSNLVRDGVIKAEIRKIRGRDVRCYPLKETVNDYLRYLRDKESGAAGDEKLKKQKLRAEIRLKESQGELHELKTRMAAGEYVSVGQLKEDYTRFFVQLRTFLLGIPGRVTGIVSGDVTPQRARQLEHELSEDMKTQMRAFVVANNGPEVVDAKKPRRKRRKAAE